MEQVGFILGGLVAGEGAFSVANKGTPLLDGSPRLRFAFSLSMASRDRTLVAALHGFLGRGSIHDTPRRHEHWEPTSTLTIASNRAHHEVTIPFAESFLPRWSAKWDQFCEWRKRLLEYESRPRTMRRGRSPCRMPGCDKPVRGQGLCRSHYYRVTGY